MVALQAQAANGMIRHMRFFIVVAVALYFISTYESEVDALVNSGHSVLDGSGIRDVDVDSVRYDYRSQVVKGTYTVLYFYSDSCPTCRRVDADLKRFIKTRPDVAVRKFDLGYYWSSAKAYETYGLRIKTTPFIHVYDEDGRLVAEDVDPGREGQKFLYNWMNAEYRKAWEQEQAAKR